MSDRYEAVFRAAPDGILLVEADGMIAEANPEALRLFGYTSAELVGQSVDILVPEGVRGGHERHRTEYVNNPHPRPMGIGLELQAVGKNGVRIPVEISLSPLSSAQAGRVIAIVRDLTERRRLKGFGVGALRAAEEERSRIARELHDDTAQSLASLLMWLRVLEKRLEGHPALKDLGRMRTWLHDTMEGVRRIARGLRPPELEDVGLAAALRRYVRERFDAITVEFEFDGAEDHLAPEQQLVLYRIAQEALSNAVRHGGAGHIRLMIGRDSRSRGVQLQIIDDGRGFAPESAGEPGSGLGLVGMDERAQLAGGRFRVESQPGEGTRIVVVLPLVQLTEEGGVAPEASSEAQAEAEAEEGVTDDG